MVLPVLYRNQLGRGRFCLIFFPYLIFYLNVLIEPIDIINNKSLIAHHIVLKLCLSLVKLTSQLHYGRFLLLVDLKQF